MLQIPDPIPPARAPASPRTARLAFDQAELEGLRVSFLARSVALGAVGLWLAVSVPFPRVLFYLGVVALFLGIEVVGYALRNTRQALLWRAALTTLDVALLTAVLILPNPLGNGLDAAPPQLRLRFHDFLYLLAYLAAATLSASPALVLWTGIVSAIGWSLGNLWIWSQPGTVTTEAALAMLPPGTAPTTEQTLSVLLHPSFFNTSLFANQIALLLVITGLLATSALLARRYLHRFAAAERARLGLARYFSPGAVSRLLADPESLERPRETRAAILCVDIVGFTAWAENRGPADVMAFLRSYQARMAAEVFRQDGTIDKYLGDGLLATFGTPEPRPDDAARALAAALAMIRSIERWNVRRAATGRSTVRIAIGLHFGPVVFGNLGNERRLEITAVGDAVNLACRLEGLAREHACRLVVSQALIEAVGEAGSREAGLRSGGLAPIPGRTEPVAIWTDCPS